MRINDQDWSLFQVVRAFYPLQLLIAHIKHNLVSTMVWGVLFLIVADKLGYSFGIPFLFLSPEYLGDVSSLSFLLLGFSVGGFTMGFNTYSYIKLGAHFPFLTTIAKPFLKFCINNAVIPGSFIVFHLSQIWRFQAYEEFKDTSTIVLYILFYLIGVSVFIVFSILYFFPLTRKNKAHEAYSSKPISSVIHKKVKWYEIFKKERHKTYIYIGKGFKLMPSRSSKHFDKKLVEQIYAKNRVNASVYEILTISIFFGLGFFSNLEIFEVPAAFSIVLLFTIFQMLFSALQSWLKGWVYPILVLLILSMNFLSTRTGLFNYTSYAYGLDYSKTSEYSIDRIKQLANDKVLHENSYSNYLKILNNWKKQTGEQKPKLIIVNTSGGGSRSALWTVTVLQHLDSTYKGNITKHTQLISGASGGMVGAAYYRQLLLEHKIGRLKNLYDTDYRENIGKDMLNKLSFMASTNDIFIRYQKCFVDGYQYTKDRGYAFEQQLIQNTNGLLDKNLAYYEQFEKEAIIPVMLFSPTIVNDGRRLLLGSQSFHFMTGNYGRTKSRFNSNENVNYQSLCNNQKTGNLKFTSTLRASATFPFVMPMITLPTNPSIQLMDAGIRDNYGGKSTIEILTYFEDWIRENTSGVIILQIRDTKKILEGESYAQVSFMDKITLPFGNMYKNFPRVQDFNQDELMKVATERMGFTVDFVSFNLLERKGERIALSWHLTSKEKDKIQSALKSQNNKMAVEKLGTLLNKKGKV